MIRSRKCHRAKLEQVGDIFRLTLFDTGEIKDFKNPIEAKMLYNLYLTDDCSYRKEIAEEGYNPYTGKKGGCCI